MAEMTHCICRKIQVYNAKPVFETEVETDAELARFGFRKNRNALISIRSNKATVCLPNCNKH
jgi:hypothetical protein